MENSSSASKQGIRTDNAPKPAGPYSQAIVAGDLVFVAGQGPTDPATGQAPPDVGDQTRQVLRNLGAILEAAGSSLDKVVKVTAHLSTLDHFAAFNAAYGDFFSEPYPVRTTVGSELRGIQVEIDVIATR
jgi:2-iminobutanoate/2-iminopropanoate deaminase